MVLCADVNATGFQTFNRLVAVMTEFHFGSFSTVSQCHYQVTHAEAQHRFLAHKSFYGFDNFGNISRVAGTVGDYDTIGVMAQNFFSGGACREHSQVAIHTHEEVGNFLFETQVQYSNVKLAFAYGVGFFGGYLSNLVVHFRSSKELCNFSFACFSRNDYAFHHTIVANFTSDGTSVDTCQSRNVLFIEEVLKGTFATPVARIIAQFTDYQALAVSLTALVEHIIYAGIANDGISQNHNLTAVGGVGKHFLIPTHTTGSEYNFANCVAFTVKIAFVNATVS